MSDLCIADPCGTTGPRQAEPGLRLCLWHLNRLHRDLAAAPLIARWLSYHTIPGSGSAEPVSGSRESASPLRLDVMSMLLPGAVHPDDGPPSIPSTLATWIWQVCEERGLHGPKRWDDITTMADWLTPHADWCAGRTWAAEMADDMAALRRCAHALVPWRVHRRDKAAPCPSCNILGLVQVAGEHYIECDERVGGCGHLLTAEEYDAHTATLAGLKVFTARCPACDRPALVKDEDTIACDERLQGCGHTMTAEEYDALGSSDKETLAA